MVELNIFLDAFIAVIVVYFFVINTAYLAILVLSMVNILRNARLRFTFALDQVFKFRLLPPVSILLPAYNEEKTIVESIRSLLFVRYPNYELVVVNDGSKDATLGTLIEEFRLVRTDYIFRNSIRTAPVRGIYVSKEFANIVVIDKENGGKADALNAGINVSKYPFFCAVDADTILGADALAKLILPFIANPERTVAVGGVVKAANGADIQAGRLLRERLTKNVLVILQSVEYARSFFMGRLGLATINSLLIISGAFGMFRKEDVLKVEGYKRKSLGEDMMLVMKLHKLKRDERKRYRIAFVHDTVCWTELPSNFKMLKKQRLRWQMGLLESIAENRAMFFNPRYGIVGMFAIPFHFFTEIVPPFIELAGYAVIAAGLAARALGDPPFAVPYINLIHFLAVTWLYSVIHSFIAISIEHYAVGTTLRFHHFIVKLLVSFLDNLFYRQVNLVYRCAGVFKFFTKRREWGEMKRSGYK